MASGPCLGGSIGLVVLSAQVSGLKSPSPGPAPPVPARVGTTAAATGVPRVPAAALPPVETPKATIEQAQRLLARLGYPVGPADGIVGPKTRAAVKAFQRKEGLAESGKVSDELLSQLRRARQRI
jgi:peptidoglycan hydrolase-like protein with peptidoglycan-binding domain